jgi:choline dehydrogenase
LYVVDSAWVTKINFQRKRATSVDWYDALEQRTFTTRASNEIIISAGGIQTPKLLQLSGVGDAAHLESLGIEVVHNLPGVGQNLMDHPITNLGASTGGLPDVAEYQLSPAAYAQWQANKTGPYSNIGGRMVLFLRTKYQVAANDPRPDIEVIGGTPGSTIFGAIYLLLPKSRGYVQITHNDPFRDPLPVGNFFQNYADIAALCEGIRMLNDIYSNLGPGYFPFTAPANISDDGSCYAYLAGFAPWTVGTSNTGSHWSGTARIGQASNPAAVVDHRLRVHGIENLRVADASVFPDIPAANTQAATYMVGEKAAAMILEDN